LYVKNLSADKSLHVSLSKNNKQKK